MTALKKPGKKFFDTLHETKKYTHIHTEQKKPIEPTPARTKKVKSTWRKLLGWMGHHTQLILYGTAIIGTIIVGAFFIWVATLKIPTLDNFATRKVTSSTQIYDRNGIILYDVHENIKRTVVPGNTIDIKIKHAIIAIEDKDFYQHHGIKFSSTIRAILVNITPLNGTQGGSTITQQVIKNTLLNSEKRISRKIKEWILSLKLERVMSKDDILALYLNEAPYGGSVYGVEQAAKGFFGKSSSDVTLAEAAYLASIPNAPSYYSPYGKNKNLLDNRKNLVLKKMLEQAYINQEEYNQAKDEVVVFKPQSDSNGKALHFVDYIRSYLEENYGKESLLVDGLKVTTTLDWTLQEQAEKIVHDNALKNEKDWNASNMAMTAIDPKTGQILTMVGSRDYSDPLIDGQFNVTTATRQPGSSFKPIIYTRAFEKGYRPETVLFDVPTQFSASCGAFSRESSNSGCYAPDNYDGKFVGPISLRSALGQSRNIPAVQLLYLVGIGDALQTAKQLGITTLDKNFDRYGLTLVLGGGEVSLLELTSVYGVFGNDGVRVPPTGILKIEDLNGKVLEEYKQKGEQVISTDASRMISSVLSDNVARTPLFGANSQLNFGDRPVASKSGTTNDNKDAWLIGYTPDIAVGVWSGNNDNKPMKKGSSISVPAWRSFMNLALKDKPISTFGSYSAANDKLPPVIRGLWWGGESFFTDKISGKLATEYTPTETKEEHVITNPHNILYWLNKSNLLDSRPGVGISDNQYKNWEATFQSWITTNGLGNIPATTTMKPVDFDDVHRPEFEPIVLVDQPTINKSVGMNQSVTITAIANGPHPIQKFEYYINDQFIGSNDGVSGNYSFVPSDYVTVTGNINLRVVAVDSVYNRGEKIVPITIMQ